MLLSAFSKMTLLATKLRKRVFVEASTYQSHGFGVHGSGLPVHPRHLCNCESFNPRQEV
jgi:hypothetical protein